MNKLLPVGVFITTASFPLSVFSATEIPAVVVSAARTEQSTLTTPASITIINRQDIDNSGARHIIEVLRGQGGVQINDFYGDGSRSSVGMRGFGETAGSNTLVLVDGRRLNNPDIAPPDLNSIALDDVERIEIVQGSAGVLFGDQAVGGVINIITRKPGALRHSLKLSAGSYETVKFHGATSQALDNGINYRVSLDARDSDNYRDHNEASYLNAFGKLGYDYDSGLVFGELQYVNDELNTPGALFANEVEQDRRQVLPAFAGDFSDLKTTVGRLGVVQELSDNWSLEAELTSRESEGEFRLSFLSLGPSTDSSTQDRNIIEFTPRFIGFIPSLNNTMLTLGADVIESDYKLSSQLGDQLNDQSQRSLYAQVVIPATTELDVTLGARYAKVENELTDSNAFNTVQNINDDITVGTFGMSYRFDNQWRVLARIDQNFRFAKVEEYSGAQPFPTPPLPVTLKTQEGLSLETGVEWSTETVFAKLLVYQLDIENEIVFDPVLFRNVNLEETRRTGLIASGRWQLLERLGITANYTYTDGEQRSGSVQGKEIPFVAKHSGLLTADYQANKSWRLYAELVAISDRVFSGDFNNVLGRLPGYGSVNANVEYSYRDFLFNARVNNLLNNHYSDVGQLSFDPTTFLPAEAFYPSPETNFLLTAAWQFR